MLHYVFNLYTHPEHQCRWRQARTTDAQWSLFSSKSQTFELGQTNWADKFGGIWGIFGWFIRTHFGTVSPLSMFSINQPLPLQKTKPLYQNPNSLGFSRQFGQINFWAFGVFSADLSAPILVLWFPCPCFPLINQYFYKKTKSLYPHPKYLFGIGIWIWEELGI